MPTIQISPKCKTLVDAAIKRWPDVYGPEVREGLAKKLETIATDEASQILATRTYLLDWAAQSCGSCQDCSLHNNRCCGAVWGDGSPNAKVFVIGEGPGQYEQRTTIPFTYAPELSRSYCRIMCKNFIKCYPIDNMKGGHKLPECAKQRQSVTKAEATERVGKPIPHIYTASQYLDLAIENLFTRDSWNGGRPLVGEERVASDLYITNLVRCRSLDKEGDDTPPLVEHTKACWKWLELQLTVVQPQVVIILGRPAGSFIFGMSDYKMTEFDGTYAERPDGRMPKLPASVKFVGTAFHPSYIKRAYDDGKAKGDDTFRGIRSVFERAYITINGG